MSSLWFLIPLKDKSAHDLGAKPVELVEIFESCDYISLHMPENDETRGIINADLIGRMKTGGTLINCARAGILNEDHFRALKEEKQLRLLNDVYPKDEAGNKPISDIADIMLPHLGASTKEANFNAASRAATQIIGLDDKGIASYVVNRDVRRDWIKHIRSWLLLWRIFAEVLQVEINTLKCWKRVFMVS